MLVFTVAKMNLITRDTCVEQELTVDLGNGLLYGNMRVWMETDMGLFWSDTPFVVHDGQHEMIPATQVGQALPLGSGRYSCDIEGVKAGVAYSEVKSVYEEVPAAIKRIVRAEQRRFLMEPFIQSEYE